MNPRLRIFRYIWWREKADKIFYINIYTCLYLKGGTDVKYSKKKLIKDMPGLYAVAEITLDGKVFYAAASENRNGKVYIVEATTGKATEINGGLGGVMAILDIKEENAILFIEEFYPVFDSAAAKIVKVNLAFDGENYFAAKRQILAKVPYVHRIGLLKEEDGVYLAAGKLCKSKSSQDDWSTSGTMEIGKYISGNTGVEMQKIYDGVTKHHAMFISKNRNGYDDLYFGGSQGVFTARYQNKKWQTEQLLDVPTSDIVYLDLDGDGKEELAIIEEFHGNKATIFKDMGKGMERVVEIPLEFGHVLWGGSFLGRPALITGSRAGEKGLNQYYFGCNSFGETIIESRTIIDEGQAPAQIFVIEEQNGAAVIAANHGAGSMAEYRCNK